MFENIKPIRKSECLTLSYDSVNLFDMIKYIKYIPLGLDEVMEMTSVAPVFIGGGKQKDFMSFIGYTPQATIYHYNKALYVPRVMHHYPFLMVKAKDEKKDDLVDIIGIDMNDKYVGENKSNNIFDDNEELTQDSSRLFDDIKYFTDQRNKAKYLIQELEKRDLLMKKTLTVKAQDGEFDMIPEYYVVDKEKLNRLDPEVLALWSRRGWIGIIEAHLFSLRNFQKLSALKPINHED